MLKLKKIAITGGIGSGKSTVCRILKAHGAYQVNSDAIVHQLLSQDKSCIQQIIQILGTAVLVDGKIDRKKIAHVVFEDREKLNRLENILHSRLLEEVDKEYAKALSMPKHLAFVVEMPLIQEIGKTEGFDLIVAVICSDEQAKVRAKRTGLFENDFEKRMARQWSTSKKAKQADYIIVNNQSIENLEQEVQKLIAHITTNEENDLS